MISVKVLALNIVGYSLHKPNCLVLAVSKILVWSLVFNFLTITYANMELYLELAGQLGCVDLSITKFQTFLRYGFPILLSVLFSFLWDYGCIHAGELVHQPGGSKVWFCVPCFFSFCGTDWMLSGNLSSSSVSQTCSFPACSKQIADTPEGME